MTISQALLSVGENPKQFVICTLLAAVPIAVWLFIFGGKHKHKIWEVGLTFFVGMLSAAIILTYQYYWGTQIDLLFFSVEGQNFTTGIKSGVQNAIMASFLIAISVGFLEEFLKHWVVKKTDHRIFESIDDVIEFSIIAALGFAFLENIGYFFRLMQMGQSEQFVQLFVMRSIFVTFIHILCSGIYGYFYGLGHFAGPVLQDYQREGKHLYFTNFFHTLFHFKRERVFRDEMATIGLIIAMTLHGTYNFLMEIDPHFDTTMGFNLDATGFPIRTILFPVILIGGFWFLSYLLDKKEDQKHFGHIVHKDEYVMSDE